MRLSRQLDEARTRKGKKKVVQPTEDRDLLLAAIDRVGAELDGDPDELDGLIESIVFSRVAALVDRIYKGRKKRKFKTVRKDEIEDAYESDGVWYTARVEYPATVRNIIAVTISSQEFSKELARVLMRYVTPSTLAKKISLDRDVLVYAGTVALSYACKDFRDDLTLYSPLASQAEQYALENSDDIEMRADPEQSEILLDLELRISQVFQPESKIVFDSPWKFRVESLFKLDARFIPLN